MKLKNYVPFTRISNAVIVNKELSWGAKALFMALAHYADNITRTCYPNQTTLMELLGVSEDTIRKYERELQGQDSKGNPLEGKPKVLAVKKIKCESGNMKNVYILLDNLACNKSKDKLLKVKELKIALKDIPDTYKVSLDYDGNIQFTK